MCKASEYTIHGAQHHFGWDNSIPPVATVAPGSSIEFECQDSSAGQLTSASTVADVEALDFEKINPVNGPVFIDGAEPGDTVKVTIDEFKPSGFGWTANILVSACWRTSLSKPRFIFGVMTKIRWHHRHLGREERSH